MNTHQISRINLSPDVVDCIVFWTKNPSPMINRLDELKDYSYYFQFTLNSYGKDVEPNLPSKNDVLIPIFQRLADKIGRERVIWRYDPILLNDYYSIDYHLEYFDKLARRLKDYTRKCIISFIDLYKNTNRNVNKLNLTKFTDLNKRLIAQELSKISSSYGLIMESCAEDIALEEFNINHGKCIDDKLIEEISGYSLDIDKDKNQRLECGCVASIDVGVYNTCYNGCKYCYANFNTNTVKANLQQHDSKSPLLCGQVTDNDIVKDRVVKSCRIRQMNLF